MKYTFFLWVILIGISCSRINLKEHNFPEPVDTNDQIITLQKKQAITHNGVTVDNLFDGARMNGFVQINDTTFRVKVEPENIPINASSYFGFRIQSNQRRKIDLEIEYAEHIHRYVPKLSYDGKYWKAMDTLSFDTLKAGNLATLELNIDRQPLFVCGQELMTSSDNREWINDMAIRSDVEMGVAGQSKLGREILYFDIDQNTRKKKDAIVIFSRLHPPEITGYIAMKSYVETILDTSKLSQLFREKYRILVYPMVNPDGVDLGHWRHNAAGIDLNRDWAFYRQKEVEVVANHVVKKVQAKKNKVVLGLDFHSTQEDIFYTLTDNRQSSIFGFKDIWLESIDNKFNDYSPKDGAYDLNTPITKGWFYLQFDAEGITYEVGDETPREFVKEKARVAAQEMMKLLVLRK